MMRETLHSLRKSQEMEHAA
ncbi:hypothetical protein R3I93_017296 [Phoxinus phoxinus]|uniref:Uncharacterized protein n=1 Tax=Phoxinus phoxinus TaxID=58324 RepID=A0AAN9GY25_9TELE